MRPPARVLILNERDSAHPKAGGAEVHVEEIFGRLAARGCEVTIASCRHDGAPAEGVCAGMRVRRLGPLPLYYARAAALCAAETRRDRYDVVVDCLNKMPFYAPLYAAVPVLALCHHLLGETVFLQAPWPVAAAVWSVERMVPWVYRRAPFVVISESTKAELVRRGIAADHIRVSLCGISQPSVPPPAFRDRAQRVVYVGRVEPYKQVDVLLRAMARLSDRFPRAEIVVIGRGRSLPALERLARELSLADRTRFTGWIDDASRDAVLADARVCVCPSKKEGWGLTIVEANALGTPVVATDAPGLRDSVREGRNGFLVPDADVDAFAERIGSLLADEELGSRMSDEARAWSRRFDWDRAADEMAECLDAARRPS